MVLKFSKPSQDLEKQFQNLHSRLSDLHSALSRWQYCYFRCSGEPVHVNQGWVTLVVVSLFRKMGNREIG